MAEQCSCTSPHAPHTWNGRPMKVCEGVPAAPEAEPRKICQHSIVIGHEHGAWCTDCGEPVGASMLREPVLTSAPLVAVTSEPPAVPPAQAVAQYASAMPHQNCTGPCCRPDLWEAGVKGVAQPSPQPASAELELPARPRKEPPSGGIGSVYLVNKVEAYVNEVESAFAALQQSHAAEVEKWKKELKAKADTTYCDYIAQMGRNECLGFDAKLANGTFGRRELTAHTVAATLLGRHQAFAEAVVTLREGKEVGNG